MPYKREPANQPNLVDSLGVYASLYRQDCNDGAAKSMTRFTVLLFLLFTSCWFNNWIR